MMHFCGLKKDFERIQYPHKSPIFANNALSRNINGILLGMLMSCLPNPCPLFRVALAESSCTVAEYECLLCYVLQKKTAAPDFCPKKTIYL